MRRQACPLFLFFRLSDICFAKVLSLMGLNAPTSLSAFFAAQKKLLLLFFRLSDICFAKVLSLIGLNAPISLSAFFAAQKKL